jgi:hypothetical protein
LLVDPIVVRMRRFLLIDKWAGTTRPVQVTDDRRPDRVCVKYLDGHLSDRAKILAKLRE